MSPDVWFVDIISVGCCSSPQLKSGYKPQAVPTLSSRAGLHQARVAHQRVYGLNTGSNSGGRWITKNKEFIYPLCNVNNGKHFFCNLYRVLNYCLVVDQHLSVAFFACFHLICLFYHQNEAKKSKNINKQKVTNDQGAHHLSLVEIYNKKFYYALKLPKLVRVLPTGQMCSTHLKIHFNLKYDKHNFKLATTQQKMIVIANKIQCNVLTIHYLTRVIF